ncbi:hypothetical protein HYW67_03785 [Candidatus Parcubacteria bacterium]|nr:hypothetical protein [Candidatus Parcubacteria bacterium]
MAKPFLELFAKRPAVFIAVVLVLAGIFAFVSLRRSPQPAAVSENPIVKTGGADALAGGSDPTSRKSLESAGETGALVYTHPKPYFSFRYPAGFTVTALPPDDNGETVLMRNPNDQKQEFQIRISEFDEPFDPAQGKPGPITPERIRKDIPDMAIDTPQTVSVGGENALAFLSRDDSLGNTREVWFVSGGYLYQITAYAEMDDLLGKILQTWEFR